MDIEKRMEEQRKITQALQEAIAANRKEFTVGKDTYRKYGNKFMVKEDTPEKKPDHKLTPKERLHQKVMQERDMGRRR